MEKEWERALAEGRRRESEKERDIGRERDETAREKDHTCMYMSRSGVNSNDLVRTCVCGEAAITQQAANLNHKR